MKRQFLILLSLLCSAGCPCIQIGPFCGFTQVTYERQTDISAPMTMGQTFISRTSDGFIKVEGQPVSTCQIQATITARAASEERARDLAQGTTIQLAPHAQGLKVVAVKPNRKPGESIDISYEAVVPKQTSLNLYSSDGHITIENLIGDIQCQSSDGHVKLCHLTGSLRIQTSDGCIQASDLHAGQLTCRSSDGRIDIKGCEAEQATVRSSDGSIHLYDVAIPKLTGISYDGSITVHYTPQASGQVDIDLKASDGSIDLVLPQEVSAQVQLSTRDGGYHLDRPITMHGNSRNRLSGTLGDGQGRIVLSTSDGNIHIQ